MSRILQRILTRREFLAGASAVLAGCASPRLPGSMSSTPIALATPSPSPTPEHFSGEIAFQHAEAQMQYIPRHTGTEGWRKCGDYILEQLGTQGWTAEEQPFTYMNTDCRNLIGKRGNGPVLVLGAHYDSRRVADEDPDPKKRTEPVPAANDGASGVAVLLELARVLRPEELGRSVWLVAFDAEDNGGLDGWDWIAGSRHFVDQLTSPIQGMVLFDMIGDADLNIYYEHNSHTAMRESLWQVAGTLGYTSFVPQLRYSMLDDHIPFVQDGIPAVDMIDFNYPYWHTTADTLDKISTASLEAVGRTAEEWIVQGAPGLPSAQTTIYLPYVMCDYGCTIRATESMIGRSMRQSIASVGDKAVPGLP